MKASRKHPALAGLILAMGVVLLLVTLPYAIGADPPTVPTFSVTDTSGAAVQYATVYAIPAADVEELATQPITRGTDGNYTADAKNVDEPLEDLINGNFTPGSGGVATYASGVTDGSGIAELPTMGTGAETYYMYVKPDAADTGHLPGGSISRTAMSGASLDNTVTAVEVSTTQSAAATFVGTSACIGCHADKTDMLKTAHKGGFMVPHTPSALQDTSKFDGDDGDWNMFAGLENKFTAAGTTVYFYDYLGTRSFDKYKTSETNPDPDGTIGNVVASVRAFQDPADGKYKMEFTNIKNPADPNSGMIQEVELTYGGGVYKQRYLTTAGNSIHMLPLQYNARGDEASSDRVRKQWRDYHMDWWISNPTGTPTLNAQPPTSKAADVQCASCHFNGYSATQIGSEWQATGVADPNGEMHPVLGTTQELNIGCETCHGPGSEHIAAGGAGEAIVSPANLTPERESTICSQCHSRPQGFGTFGSNDQPVNSSNQMLRAGISRADYLANYANRDDAVAGNMQSDGLHSKAHHQQYTDFIQSALYRNGTSLETCSSCHSNHAPGTDRNQLSGTSDDTLCLSCHAGVDSSSHQIDKSGYDMGATCIECHNVKTAGSGAGNNVTATYPHGDISSHVFDVPTKSDVGAGKMAVPYTNACGTCHWPLTGAPTAEQPALKVQKQGIYWGSFDDYTNRILSVDLNLSNDSAGIAGNAYDVQMVGTANSGGAISINTPLPVGHVPAGYGATAASTVKYQIPVGVSTFWSTIYATADDGANASHAYPGPMPGA